MTYHRVVYKLHSRAWKRIHDCGLEDQFVILAYADSVDGLILSRCNRAEAEQNCSEELHFAGPRGCRLCRGRLNSDVTESLNGLDVRQVLRVVLNEESYQFGLEMQFRDPIRSATPRTIIEAEECERIIGRRTIFARDMTLSVRSKVIACMRKGKSFGGCLNDC